MVDPAPTRSIAEVSIHRAANKTGYFEKSTLFFSSAEVSLSRAMQQHPAGQAFQSVKSTTTVRSFQLTDVVLDGDTLLLLKDGAVIPETSVLRT